jgi:DNA-binding MarR family transcriptional regulator
MNVGQEPFSDQIFHQVLAMLRFTRQHGRKMINERGIKPREFSVLRHLSDSGAAAVGQIQMFLHNSPSTTSTLIAQLEEKGYVTRTRSAEDNRVVIVNLTPLGQQVADSTPLGGLPLLRRRLSQLDNARLEEIDSVFTEIMQLIEPVDTE